MEFIAWNCINLSKRKRQNRLPIESSNDDYILELSTLLAPIFLVVFTERSTQPRRGIKFF